MKLRYRLFLWVGILFFLAFVISLIFETYTTDANLKKEEKTLRKQILNLNEERRQHTEKYLHVTLSEAQAKIDSLLLRISRDPRFGAALFLDPPNIDLAAPAHSAFLFKNDKWIDFIQTTRDQKLTANLIPLDFPMVTSYKVPIDEVISWVILDEDRELRRPFIGIKFTPVSIKKKNLLLLIDALIERDLGLTVLFDPKALINYSPKTPAETFVNTGVDMQAFLTHVEHAAEYLRDNKGREDWIKKEIQEKGGEQLFQGRPADLGIRCLREEGEVLNNKIIQLFQKEDQAIMVSALASLLPGGEFGSTPFASIAPKGIGRFPGGHPIGHMLLTDEIFFRELAFDDAKYLHLYPPSKDCSGIGSSVAIIAPKDMDRVFVGNSLKLENPTSGGREGIITIAVDADDIVEQLVLSIHKDGFLVYDDEVISAFSNDGSPITNPKKKIPFTKKMLKEKSGTVEWEGKKYYFLQMTPFKELDLHFFSLELEEEAFAIVRSIDEGSRQVIKKVSFNMRFIAIIVLFLVLLVLNKIAKRITKPISSLAKATESVAAGRLEGIELPDIPKGRHDEITTLVHSFSQMVTGLKEKEKVKGVLNKVVSPEIAQEIMKGKVQLGGEERKVTVLFADIRNFTHMSAEMPPQEVVEMLNTCMTKISHIVDEYGGVIDKYVGDEVMALFGAPLEQEDSTLKAVQCAKKMLQVLSEWNQERKNANKPPVEMGIGIHTGNVLIGNMGAENRLNYTVIGSNVNLAARLCGYAKEGQILISKETLQEPHVSENIEAEELPRAELKGYEEKILLYSVKGVKDVK